MRRKNSKTSAMRFPSIWFGKYRIPVNFHSDKTGKKFSLPQKTYHKTPSSVLLLAKSCLVRSFISLSAFWCLSIQPEELKIRKIFFCLIFSSFTSGEIRNSKHEGIDFFLRKIVNGKRKLLLFIKSRKKNCSRNK